ncbi:MAG TPA: amidohydrolase family protein [Pseudolabrys sp.]|nr:amidohydrolase family protein [Pseudolabrys sp.]
MPIDVHAHYIPQALIAAARERGGAIGVQVIDSANAAPALAFAYGYRVRPFFPKLIESTAQRVAWLDSQRLDRQLVATWPDIYGYGLPREHCAAWHRLLNDTLAEWCDENGARMSFVASVPLPDADDAAAELDRAAGLGAVAVMLASNVEGQNIGEFALDPLWKRAEQLKMPVMIHPTATTAFPRAAKFGLRQSVNYTFDTTLGVASLIFSGVLDRFPNLTFVLSHGGGAYPYLAGRFDVMHARMDRAAQGDVAQKAPSAYAPLMAYDTIVHAPKPLKFLADLVGVDRLVLGTDYSFPPADLAPLDSLRAAGLSASDTKKITEENPRRLFPRLGSQ